jgi:hypothetical protein
MCDEEIHNLYPSPTVIKKDKSRQFRWASSVAYIVE